MGRLDALHKMDKTFEIINEYELSLTDQQGIGQILGECFSTYPKDRNHFKQVPSFRLIYRNGSKIQGHIAITFRWMHLGQQTIKVFGLSDICVVSSVRTKKLATKMVAHLTKLGAQQGIDFLILIAWKPEIYQSMGFKKVSNRCRWLLIHNDQSLGIAQRSIEEGLMVKSMGTMDWSNEALDFLGPIF